MDIQKMKDLIEQKKLRGSNRKPRYATRKLTIGLVSCMLGFTLLVSPSSVLADEAVVDDTIVAEGTSDGTPTAETVVETPATAEGAEDGQEETQAEVETPAKDEGAKEETNPAPEAEAQSIAPAEAPAETPAEEEKTQADTFAAEIKTLETKVGEAVNYEESITNLPEGAFVTVKEAADVREAGEKTATLEVVFADESTKEVKVTVVVEEDVTDATISGLEIGDEIAGESVGAGEEATENNETAEFILEILQTEEGKLLKANEEPYETNSEENVLGGIQGINEEDIDVIKNIKFNVYVMENGSPKLEKEGVVPELGDKDRWSGAFYIRGLEKGKKYIFQVDPGSIPEGYHYYFTEGSSNPYPYKTMDPRSRGTLAEFDSSDTEEGKKYGHVRLHLDVLDIIFAKNEETAKNIFNNEKWVSEKNGKTYTNIGERNTELVEGEDYYKTRVGRDYSIDIPNIEDYANEGYKPLKWYITYPDWKDKDGNLIKYDINDLISRGYSKGRPFNGIYHSQDEINYTGVRLKANTTIFTLDQLLPNVTFNFNNAEDEKPSEEVSQDIYYKKSLANNMLSTGEKIETIEINPTKEGYTFVGWNTKADGTGKNFDKDTIITDELLDKEGKLTVYAQWKEKTPDKCLTKDALQKQFEDKSEEMFGGFGTKKGIYEGSFDKENKNVTVKIYDKGQDAKTLSGTGLIDGLIDLYKNNYVTKVQIGEGQVLDLAALEKAAPDSGMTFAQMLKFAIGTGMLNEVQDPDNQTGNLSDFIDKTVKMHVTLHQEGCDEAGDVILTYTINGVDGTDKTAPVITAENVTAIEGKEITPVPVTTDDDKATVTVTGLPEGLSYDSETKQIEGKVEKADDWGDEEEKTVTATVKAVDKAGNESTKGITVTIQRDTDGDGEPDVTDTDDDGDGIPDTEDENPKVADETTLTVTPETQTKVEGEDGTEINPIKAESNKPGATITTDNPNLTVGEDGQITGTLPKIEDWGDDEEERTVNVTVTSTVEGEDPVEKTVTITVQRDTDGDGTPDVTDTDDDNDGVDDKTEEEKGTDPKDKDSKPETPAEKDADKVDPTIPEKTEVEDTDKLTKEEKNTVKDKIEEANKNKFPEGTQVDVDDKGNATITYPDGSKDIIPADKLVTEKSGSDDKPGTEDPGHTDKPGSDDDNTGSTDPTKPSTDDKKDDESDEDDEKDSKEDGKTDAENNPAVAPEKTEVEDSKNLTDKEKAEVAEKVAKANPDASEVRVDNKGNATLVYPDGSMNTIDAAKTVVEKSAGTVDPSKDNKEYPRRDSKGNKLAGKNVKTGLGSVSGLIGLASAAAAGLFASKKKEDEEDK